jgi:hypothetical protein
MTIGEQVHLSALAWFERWFAKHNANCPVTRFDMSVVEHYPGRPTGSIMSCAVCHDSVSGSVRDTDLMRLRELLTLWRQSDPEAVATA